VGIVRRGRRRRGGRELWCRWVEVFLEKLWARLLLGLPHHGGGLECSGSSAGLDHCLICLIIRREVCNISLGACAPRCCRFR